MLNDKLARALQNLRDCIAQQGVKDYTYARVESTCRVGACSYPPTRIFMMVMKNGNMKISSACDEHYLYVKDALEDVTGVQANGVYVTEDT